MFSSDSLSSWATLPLEGGTSYVSIGASTIPIFPCWLKMVVGFKEDRQVWVSAWGGEKARTLYGSRQPTWMESERRFLAMASIY